MEVNMYSMYGILYNIWLSVKGHELGNEIDDILESIESRDLIDDEQFEAALSGRLHFLINEAWK